MQSQEEARRPKQQRRIGQFAATTREVSSEKQAEAKLANVEGQDDHGELMIEEKPAPATFAKETGPKRIKTQPGLTPEPKEAEGTPLCANQEFDLEAAMMDVHGEDFEEILKLEEDPLEEPGTGPSKAWLESIKNIRPRELYAPSAHLQEEAVGRILAEIEAEPAEPSPQLIAETKRALENLPQ
jgi:hypothetical protein